MNNLLIVGAGQYGFVAKDVALEIGNYDKIAFLDDNNEDAIDKINKLKEYINDFDSLFIAIGNSKVREQIFEFAKECGFEPITLVHPSAYVAKSATIESGCIIEANAVVNSNTVIKCGTLVCAGSVINHNCIVGKFCHIDVNSTVKSNSDIADYSKLEAGTNY